MPKTTVEKPDYLDAHKRHWEDAEYLYDKGSLPNADLLYGHSAESGLIAMMIANGMPLTERGIPEERERVHANDLWALARARLQGRVNLPLSNPFKNWKVHYRYYNRKSPHFDLVKVNGHKKGAQQVKDMVDEAERGGILR